MNPERQAARYLQRIIILSEKCGKLLTDLGRHSNEITRLCRELNPLGHLLNEIDAKRLEKAAARIANISKILKDFQP